jgi:cytoskeletal protein CcmA (bactofilin family)
MFLKNKSNPVAKIAASHTKDSVPSMISKDFHLLGNIISDGVIDFDGKIDGNIRCHTLNVRKNAVINGEIVADDVFVYGKVKGIVRAKNAYLYNGSRIEGIVMHESIAIEDGAFLDGKLKRTDKPETKADESDGFEGFEETTSGDIRVLDKIKLLSS